MAKLEQYVRGNFDELLERGEKGIRSGSASARLKDQSEFQLGDVRLAVRVYERYSALGQNRVSLSLTLLGQGEELFISAITSGGSQELFVKINTWGEEAFLETLRPILRDFGEPS